MIKTTSLLVMGILVGCGGKNVESGSSSSGDDLWNALTIHMDTAIGWKGAKLVCGGGHTQAYDISDGTLRISNVPDDCRLTLHAGEGSKADQWHQPLGPGQSWTCRWEEKKTCNGDHVCCYDDNADALLVKLTSGDFSNMKVVCGQNGLTKSVQMKSNTGRIDGLEGSCSLYFNPGNVSASVGVTGGQALKCKKAGDKVQCSPRG